MPRDGSAHRQDQPDLPTEVWSVLEELRSALADAGALAAIVTGSTSRGEISYAREGSDFTMRSDIELYAIGDDPSALASKAATGVNKIENHYREKWPGFHIDIAYLSPQQFRSLPPSIRHFEMKANAYVLLGSGSIDALPDVDISNLDWRELNEVVLWQLLGVVSKLSIAWLGRGRDLTAAEKLALVSVLLNITTWALPGEGVLLATYRDRVNFWARAESARFFEGTGIDSGYLSNCLASRREAVCTISDDALFGSAVEAWSVAYSVATGECESAHRGRGLGFVRGDLARRVRAAYRVRYCGTSRVLDTLQRGPNAVAAKNACKLAIEALDLRESGADPAIRSWDTRRRSLIDFVDRSLNRKEWSRYLPEEGK